MKYNLVFVISYHWFWRDFKWLLQMQILYVVRWNPSYNSSTDVAQMSGEKNSAFADNFYVRHRNFISKSWIPYEDQHYHSILQIEKLRESSEKLSDMYKGVRPDIGRARITTHVFWSSAQLQYHLDRTQQRKN